MNPVVYKACRDFDYDGTRVLDILREVQSGLGCISGETMEMLAKELSTHRVEIEGLVSFYSFFSEKPKGKIAIRLCDDIIDRFAGVSKVAKVFSDELGIEMGKTSPDGIFSLEYTPCIGMSDQAPSALINQTVVTKLTPQSARTIARKLKKNPETSELLTRKGDGNNACLQINAMVKNNIRVRGEVLLCEGIPAEAGLKKALKRKEDAVIQEIRASGLRGRGGAGFSTGLKWDLARRETARERYVICNADEGEPGTFKDRVLLTERTDLMFEGMTIAARAIGSRKGILYVRAEYTYLLPYLEHVLKKRRKRGLLGRNIAGKKGFAFDIRIQLGAGAYICGEESSLISSCEGLRGEPKNRPPFPAEKGFLGYPTIVNNVETFCCAARILDGGAPWFAGIGTDESAGTKLLSVAGDCARPGIYEVPFGIEVSEVLDMAGADDPAIVQIGGASGDMIGRTAFHKKICYEDLPTGGSFMTFNSTRNVLGIVDYFLEFFIHESCGYCTPCRVGNVFLRERIQKIKSGLAEEADLHYLIELSNTIMMTSRCGLGHTSPRPVLSSIAHFPIVYASLTRELTDGRQASFDIQKALEESRRIAKRQSMIYDPIYGESTD
ncbi:MAG: NAD(P)H-dependent oxidoreductase subunit E [Nitrospiraceae bacterium]|nr:MAG: NAD(P)H-dependent oxidoreductase subunit E [Nitrospiraceae bacterium]